MALKDKAVSLEGLKAVYDSQDTDGIKQDVADLKSSIGLSGVIPIDYTNDGNVNQSLFYAFSSGTSKINLDTPTAFPSMNSGIIPVKPGSRFLLTGKGGNGGRLWAFVPALTGNVSVISVSDANVTANNLELTAPAGAVGLVVNHYTTDAFSLKNVSVDALELKKDVSQNTIDIGIGKTINKAASAGSQLVEFPITAGHTYKFINNTNEFSVSLSSRTESNEKIETISSALRAHTEIDWTAAEDAWGVFIYLPQSTGTLNIDFYDVGGLYGEIRTIKEEKANFPMVHFADELETTSFASELEQIDYTSRLTIMPQVYSLFDALASNYSDYVEKVDAASLVSLAYPTYANGISTEGEYLETPAYKTYMYKLIGNNQYVNTAENPKKILLIVGGKHGDEVAAPFNLYLFAKQLCEASKENYFKFRSAFDVYIIPCLNGYGLYHGTRVNANGVNINRNYPVFGWVEHGEGTENYTGETAGSEFETKLIMAITSLVNPDFAVDHHNYTKSEPWQYYTYVNTKEQLKIAYEVLVNCSYVFKKEFPTYFGSAFGLLQNQSGSAPGTLAPSNGMTSRYWYENGINIGATFEVSDSINYLNGEPSTAYTDKFSNNVFRIAEYTLRTNVFKFAQAILDNKV